MLPLSSTNSRWRSLTKFWPTRLMASPSVQRHVSPVSNQVRGNLSTPEAIDKIGGRIPPDSVRQIEVRPELSAVDGAASFRVKNRSCVLAGGIKVHMNLLEAVSGA